MSLTAAENVVSGTFIGAAGIANGAIFNVAGTGFVHSSKGTNQLLAAGNTIGLSARTYALFETLRIQVKRELEYHKFKKKHELPGQIMKDRLAALDKMEKQLKGN
jgi:hypothetical protein